jgi:crotonobetaine/carnitine-CoA ligase
VAVTAAVRNSPRPSDFKVPREIRFVDELPRSTLEKVAKAELRKLLD